MLKSKYRRSSWHTPTTRRLITLLRSGYSPYSLLFGLGGEELSCPSLRPQKNNTDKATKRRAEELNEDRRTLTNSFCELTTFVIKRAFSIHTPNNSVVSFSTAFFPRSLDCNWRSRTTDKGLTMPTTLVVLILKRW